MARIAEGDWPRVFALLDTALEIEPHAREAWLESLQAAGEPALPALREVLASRALIETKGFLAAPASPTLGADYEGERLEPGLLVGTYRLVRSIASGGMGEVWLAERADGLIRRQVALKLPHAGPRSAAFIERFARERNILAALEHPHIARLYDAGLTAQGQPFLAMEYVEGAAITAWCDQQRLPVQRRVALFIQVLRALQHAHGRLIVHRDLKPNNILVDSAGDVKLLDFGIAKLLQPEGQPALDVTQLAGRMVTPAYASPEQLAEGDIGIASDVYSAGVVLYELMTGSRPYEVRPGLRSELESAIVAGRLIPPHRVQIAVEAAAARTTSPARLAALLAGDLGTVLAKALKTLPGERYATAEAFAEDLERLLHHQPVRARPDSAWYRTKKFIARNRYAVTGASLLGFALVVGLVITVWSAQQARHHAARAEEIKRFTLSIFTSANPLQGGGANLRAVDLLVQARERVEKELAGRSQEQAELLCTIGVSLSNLSALPESRKAYESALRVASTDPVAQRSIADCELDYAMALLGMDELDSADRILAGLEPRLRSLGPTTGLGKLLSARSALVRIRGNEADALPYAEEAAAVTRTAAGADSREYANALMQLGRIQYAAGRLEAAVTTAEEGLERLPRAVGTSDHPDMPLFRVMRASALSDLGRHREATDLFEAAMPQIAQSFGMDSQEHVVDLYFFALAERRRGDLKRALKLLQESVERGKRGGLANELVSFIRNAQATTYLMARQGDEARRAASDALELGTKSDPVIESRLIEAQRSLAMADALRGDLGAAMRALAAQVESMRRAGEGGLATPLHYLGEVELLAGHPADALAHLVEAERLTAEGTPRRRVLLPMMNIGAARALLELDRVDEAQQRLQSAVDALATDGVTMNPAIAEAHTLLARASLRRGETAPALLNAAKADSFWRDFDAQNDWAGEAAYWYGASLGAAGRTAESRKALERGRRILAQSSLPGFQALGRR